MVSSKDLSDLFRATFFEQEQTLLCGGAKEPLYTPIVDDGPAIIYFREDFVASALHEVAHWCIAGAKRRRLVDYGYWYVPDGRSPTQQVQFIGVEARPQALEWCFSQALAVPFRVSMDNLEAQTSAAELAQFSSAIREQAVRLKTEGLPGRARVFFDQLTRHFNPSFSSIQLNFSSLPRS
ncbi:MAG: elongation factor P hydroxylase [Pseudomonadota bacterium]